MSSSSLSTTTTTTTTTTKSSGSNSGSNNGSNSNSNNGSRPPLRIPPPTWQADADAVECRNCGAPFTALNRRHHCRQCGQIFCHHCTSKKVALPHLGYSKPERVCERCFDVAYLITYTASDSVTTQCHGVRGLIQLISKGSDLTVLVDRGGVEALIYLCGSPDLDVICLSISAVEHLARIPEMLNTLVEKKVLPALFQLCMAPVPTPTVMYKAAKSLYYLSRNPDTCKLLVNEGAVKHLTFLSSYPSAELRSKIPDTLLENSKKNITDTQSFASRAISHLAVNESNQTKMIEDKETLSGLLDLLESSNETVRKYAAKTMAYLSLRNDKLKVCILEGRGIEIFMKLLVSSAATAETLSHLCCAIANLATNFDSQQLLINDERLLEGLTAIQTRYPQDIEVLRHIARGFANFALYVANKAKLMPILPYIVQLGKVGSLDVQRHSIRAVDNLLSPDFTDDDVRQMRESGAADLLQEFSQDHHIQSRQLVPRASTNSISSTALLEIQKRAASALKKLSEGNHNPKEAADSPEGGNATSEKMETDATIGSDAAAAGKKGEEEEYAGPRKIPADGNEGENGNEASFRDSVTMPDTSVLVESEGGADDASPPPPDRPLDASIDLRMEVEEGDANSQASDMDMEESAVDHHGHSKRNNGNDDSNSVQNSLEIAATIADELTLQDRSE